MSHDPHPCDNSDNCTRKRLNNNLVIAKNCICLWVLKIVPADIGVGTKKDTSELARAMREEGKALQQIADELGYKDRSSVSRILNE